MRVISACTGTYTSHSVRQKVKEKNDSRFFGSAINHEHSSVVFLSWQEIVKQYKIL